MITFHLSLLISIISLQHGTNAARIVWDKHFSISSDDLLNSDLERISSGMLAALGLLVDDSKLERLHNLARSQPEPEPGYRDIQFQNYDYQIDYGEVDPIANKTMKRELGSRSDETEAETILNGTSVEYDYDFGKFKEEYDTLTIMTPNIATLGPDSKMNVIENDSDSPFQPTVQREKSSRCVHMKLWKHAVFGPVCLWRELKDIMTTESFIQRFFNLYIPILIVKTLFLWACIWACVATWMWCWKGNCCCCLPFLILHPAKGLQTIRQQIAAEEAQEEKVETEMTPYWLKLHKEKEKLLKEIQDIVLV